MSSPTSPYLFKEGSEENINIIKNLLKENPYAMFLRKVDRSFPDAVLEDIMSIDFGHVYPVLHNQYKVKGLDKAKEEANKQLIISNHSLLYIYDTKFFILCIITTLVLVMNYYFI